jgi:hypothetical protein
MFHRIFILIFLLSALVSVATGAPQDSLQQPSSPQTRDTTKLSNQVNAILLGYSFGPDFGFHDNAPIGYEYFITYCHNDRIYTLRHVVAASVNINIPIQTINETAILYGVSTTYRGLFLTASAGLEYQENSIRGKYLYSQSDSMQVFQMNASHSFGLALQLSATAETWRFLNLGLGIYADLNSVLPDYGIVMRWQFNIYL